MATRKIALGALLLLPGCSLSPFTDTSQLQFLQALVEQERQEIFAEEQQLAAQPSCPARPVVVRRH